MSLLLGGVFGFGMAATLLLGQAMAIPSEVPAQAPSPVAEACARIERGR